MGEKKRTPAHQNYENNIFAVSEVNNTCDDISKVLQMFSQLTARLQEPVAYSSARYNMLYLKIKSTFGIKCINNIIVLKH